MVRMAHHTAYLTGHAAAAAAQLVSLDFLLVVFLRRLGDSVRTVSGVGIWFDDRI